MSDFGNITPIGYMCFGSSPESVAGEDAIWR